MIASGWRAAASVAASAGSQSRTMTPRPERASQQRARSASEQPTARTVGMRTGLEVALSFRSDVWLMIPPYAEAAGARAQNRPQDRTFLGGQRVHRVHACTHPAGRPRAARDLTSGRVHL